MTYPGFGELPGFLIEIILEKVQYVWESQCMFAMSFSEFGLF